jgi:hypothetical protein
MKPTKPIREKYVAGVIAILLSENFTKKEVDYSDEVNLFTAEGNKNSVEVIIYNEKDHEILFSTYSKFKKCNELTDKYNSKYNLHLSVGTPIDLAIEMTKDFILKIKNSLNN